MAEQIISPGVFQNENVPVTLEAAAAPIGAALITPSTKGPVGIPTTVTTYSDYKTKFGSTVVSGGAEYAYLGNISAQNYFKQGGSNLLVTRVVSASAVGFTAASSSNIVTGSHVGVGGTGVNNVFTLETISEGENQNSNSTATSAGALPEGTADNLRFEISNVDSGSGIFTLSIRQGKDRTADKTILETFRGVSLDPKRDDYIAKVIGNQTFSVGTDGTDSFVQVDGEYPNKSKYVIVSEVNKPTPDYLDGAGAFKPAFTSSMPANQEGTFSGGTGDLFPSDDTVNWYKDISNTQTQGLSASDYSTTINLLKNKDQYPFNVISTPGLIYENTLHATQMDKIITNTTSRGDSIFPIDIVNHGSTVANAVSTAGDLNTNYAAAYWPWLLVNEEDSSANVWAPASTILPSVYVFNDNTSEAWFAPAGFTRGTMPNVVAPEKTLPRGLRDTLYNAKINPIATFPGTGVVVYGQKTLQSLSTAIDRGNVRR